MSQITPLFVTVDPTTGKIGADFTGNIRAKGLILDYEPGSPDNDAIRWLRPSDQQRAGLIIASQDAGGHPFMTLLSNDPDAAYSAEIDIDPHMNSGLAAIGLGMFDPVNSTSKTLLQSDGKSDFLQLTGLAKRALNMGSAVITWPGASGASNVVAINHGLGRVPVAVTGQVFTSAGVALAPYISTINTYTSTQFSVQCVTTGAAPPNTATTTIVWIAVG